MKARIFNIMQYKRHPKTGETLLTEEQILNALDHKSIIKYGYILHDKDVYMDADEMDDPDHKSGDLKPPHWHIVLQCSQQLEIDTIAKWFGIAPNFIDVPKGKGRDKYIDCIEYLTHEHPTQQKLGKHRYADEEVHSNFDYRSLLTKRRKDLEKYGTDLTPRDQIRYDVLYTGKTLRQCMDDNKLLYMQDIDKLQKLRIAHISELNPPKTRINFFVSGSGGAGKGLISKAIARSLYPDLKNDNDIFYIVGSKGSCFEGYDGQAVIIWSDRRSYDLLQELNGRGNVFSVFDPHPDKHRQNIKYGSVNLCNEINIVNSVENPIHFLDGLSGEYTDRMGEHHMVEDKSQAYRRFPFIIDIHSDYYDLWINDGFSENAGSYQSYTKRRYTGSLPRLYSVCGSKTDIIRDVENKMVQPIKNKYREIVDRIDCGSFSDDIYTLISGFGSEVEIPTIPEDLTPGELTLEEEIHIRNLFNITD